MLVQLFAGGTHDAFCKGPGELAAGALLARKGERRTLCSHVFV